MLCRLLGSPGGIEQVMEQVVLNRTSLHKYNLSTMCDTQPFFSGLYQAKLLLCQNASFIEAVRIRALLQRHLIQDGALENGHIGILQYTQQMRYFCWRSRYCHMES